MEIQRLNIGTPGIVYSVGWHNHMLLEELIDQHLIVHILSGEMRLIGQDSDQLYRTGDTVLVCKNYLIKCIGVGIEKRQRYESIVFVLDEKLLEDYALKYEIPRSRGGLTSNRGIVLLSSSLALSSLFDSLDAYRKSGKQLSEPMRRHKLEEAILALAEQGHHIFESLFDFPQPGKIDLKAFMLRNYMFNIPISRFASLTGRSVSTFRRDFQQNFGMKASVWLVQKRLSQALQLLREGNRPIDVYLDVGFADISHFSRAFKKDFGYPPSQVRKQINPRPLGN
ncbi:helix-turn-helix domain-containing protein [Pedobacter miscanthi]|jgi:AraC-like DNA-binding protein|uniref:AraC family transcriptional regulator n=1 Tax=Pedobacter miscanthi TaxID=2259170 RepID=A0A366L0A5_9SPHI|nr:AraC family transcriptional regulator [Pedobacter miscanthi]RBQ06734.1 AraC family transcriptional regulator [Pedobacter miscanthi]